jgi:hypothetical protein
VLGPLVGGPAVPPGPQDQQLAVAGRQRARQQLAAEGQPAAEQPGVADQGCEDVGGRGDGAAGLGQQLAGLVVDLGFGQRGDAGSGRADRAAVVVGGHGPAK